MTRPTPLEHYAAFLEALKADNRRRYDRRIVQDLAAQQSHQMLHRNAVAVMDEAYGVALEELRRLELEPGAPGTDGLSEAARAVLERFDGFVDDFLEYVVQKHRSSCALSNFPAEHRPSMEYLQRVTDDIALLWARFAHEVNRWLSRPAS